MILFPNAKINLGLNVLRKREDGYHDIETCLIPLAFYDILEILPSKDFSFTQSGIKIPSKGKNLVVSAYELLKQEFDLPAVHMHLHKIIPPGAGLGGGSSDAASALTGFNQLFDLKLSKEQLTNYAQKLGSDCPFFIFNQPALATGTGNILSPCDPGLAKIHLRLILSDLHINTSEAYEGLQPKTPQIDLRQAIATPGNRWKELIGNDFEAYCFTKHPKLKAVKDDLYDAGAFYASLTGSGSCVFGLFENPPARPSQRNTVDCRGLPDMIQG